MPKKTTAAPGAEAFLPVSRADMEQRGWDRCDFVYISGDAYVDHPSFGMAIITRLLEARGYKVGVIAQPDWNEPASVAVLGEPRLAFLVSSGNMDSMVNHYTAAKKKRHRDAYSPGGQAGLRPNHATVVYSNLIRRTFKSTPIIVGGIEASLRRFAHYDYWSDKMKRSLLLDAGADLLIYGMGERPIVEVADALSSGLSIRDVTYVDGTVYRASSLEHVYDAVELPPFAEVGKGSRSYARSFAVQYRNSDPFTGKRLVEPYSDHEFVVQNPPAAPLSVEEMDAVYALPYVRDAHPMYAAAGGVPALSEVRFSLTSNRGCFGECAFCALTFHQGRIVQVRSHESLVAEAEAMTHDPAFKGYINDVGGPTADFRAPACRQQLKRGACVGKRCLSPQPCAQLEADHGDYLELLRRLSAIPGVKKVFVRSGVRFDYVMADERHGREFLDELTARHVSGQLRVAPEHVSDNVLAVMGKPPHEVYERFCKAFQQATERAGLEQYVVPYLMSSHPGSTLRDAVKLAEYVRDMGFNPEQVQDFYPTPGSLATVMYATGFDPRTMEKVYVARSPHEKALQRALIQYRNPANRELVREALQRANRTDLIGYGENCLVRPDKENKDRGKRGIAGEKLRARQKRAQRQGAAMGKGGKRTGASHGPAPKNASSGGKAARGMRPAAAPNRKHRGPAPKANGRKGGIRKGR
ncbi:MAG: YgiQ family radical SAM protein [Eggerthellaceae bacterium]|nr:YgiQ family radical SAM protein [Eggerthellaceae bacterium]